MFCGVKLVVRSLTFVGVLRGKACGLMVKLVVRSLTFVSLILKNRFCLGFETHDPRGV